jgi:hypothetical protein
MKGFIMDNTTSKCVECKDTDVDLDGNDDSRWSPVKQGQVCWGCYESAEQSASTLYFVEHGEVAKAYITDLDHFSEYGDPLDWALPKIADKVNREWRSTDAWRGYYNTTVDGWVDVLDGWTTGSWGDPVARRKADFNEWAEQLFSGEIVPPCAVVIATDPTSNLFSTAITVFVEASEVETFRNWLVDDYDTLYSALS